jgi:hypothetical protein
MVGFGRQVTWTSDLVVPPGHQMTFKDALHILSSKVILKVVVPYWARNLTEQTRKVNLAFTELGVCDLVHLPHCLYVTDASLFGQQYMLEMVEARRKSDKTEQRHDLFTGLLDAAAEEPDNGVALSDQELLGKYPMSHCFA